MVPKTIIFDFDGTMAVLFAKTLITETTAAITGTKENLYYQRSARFLNTTLD